MTQRRQRVNQTRERIGHEFLHIVLIDRVGEAKDDEIVALREDRLRNLCRSLADNHTTDAVFPSFLGDALDRPPGGACPRGASAARKVVVGFFEDEQHGKIPTVRIPEVEVERKPRNQRYDRVHNVERDAAHVHDGDLRASFGSKDLGEQLLEGGRMRVLFRLEHERVARIVQATVQPDEEPRELSVERSLLRPRSSQSRNLFGIKILHLRANLREIKIHRRIHGDDVAKLRVLPFLRKHDQVFKDRKLAR